MSLKEIGSFLYDASTGKLLSGDAFKAMSKWQQEAILSSKILSNEQKNILSGLLTNTSATTAQAAATTGLSTAFKGLAASAKSARTSIFSFSKIVFEEFCKPWFFLNVSEHPLHPQVFWLYQFYSQSGLLNLVKAIFIIP